MSFLRKILQSTQICVKMGA